MKTTKTSSAAARLSQLLVALFIVGGTSMGITGCEDNDGAAENFGESVDEGLEEAGDEIDDNS